MGKIIRLDAKCLQLIELLSYDMNPKKEETSDLLELNSNQLGYCIKKRISFLKHKI